MHASSCSPIFQTCDLMCTFPPFQSIATTNARNRIGIEIRRGFLRLDNTSQGRRKSMVSLQPIQQLWTACPCKIFGKVRESLHVGSAYWAIRLRSVLGSLRSYGGRAALLVTPFLVSCLHALGGILFTPTLPLELCRRAASAPFVAARISYLESKQKRQPPGWLLTLSDREPSCVWVHRCRLLFFSSLL